MRQLTIHDIQGILEAGPKSETYRIGWAGMDVPVRLFVRWSNGPDKERTGGCSRDAVTGQQHLGLSANPIRESDPEHISQRIGEYRFLSMGGAKPYIFWGAELGKDSDGACITDVIEVLGVPVLS